MDKKISFNSEPNYYSEPVFKIFRVHPNGSRIEKAEKTLHGAANKSALTYCGPYGSANSFGWWVYPAVDIDIICHEHPVDGCYHGRWGGHYTYSGVYYDNKDFSIMSEFESKVDNEYGVKYNGKAHCTIDEPEKHCISIWTGCFMQMPKDWCLMIKSPTNTGLNYDQAAPVCVQEGILELDWMRYDIWMNLKFNTFEKKLSLRRDQDWPIAQLIPIHRSAIEADWQTDDRIMDADDPECVTAYARYAEYNHKKWVSQGEKDPFTFRKLKKSVLNQNPTEDLFSRN